MKLTNTDIDNWILASGKPFVRCTDYLGMNVPVEWKCTKCSHSWIAIPSGLYYRGSGCPNCAGNVPITNEFVDKEVANRNIIRLANVQSNGVKILWKCAVCSHEWKATPSKVINSKTGCPKCANRIRLTNHDIDERCLPLGIQRVDDYITIHTKIRWKCNKCKHVWLAKPSNILNKHTGCPSCRTPSYSKKAVAWLNEMSTMHSINIQHAENGGEYIIPGTLLKVDGFDISTNTIYEFYGDIFHGNLQIFDRQDMCSPYHQLTAGELYDRTMRKEQQIRDLGYKLITIWESEYDRKQKTKRAL